MLQWSLCTNYCYWSSHLNFYTKSYCWRFCAHTIQSITVHFEKVYKIMAGGKYFWPFCTCASNLLLLERVCVSWYQVLKMIWTGKIIRFILEFLSHNKKNNRFYNKWFFFRFFNFRKDAIAGPLFNAHFGLNLIKLRLQWTKYFFLAKKKMKYWFTWGVKGQCVRQCKTEGRLFWPESLMVGRKKTLW